MVSASFSGGALSVNDALTPAQVVTDIGDTNIISVAGSTYSLGAVTTVSTFVVDGGSDFTIASGDIIESHSLCNFKVNSASRTFTIEGTLRGDTSDTAKVQLFCDDGTMTLTSATIEDCGTGNSYIIRHDAGTFSATSSTISTNGTSIQPYYIYDTLTSGTKAATFTSCTFDVYGGLNSGGGLFFAGLGSSNSTLTVTGGSFSANTRATNYVYFRSSSEAFVNWKFDNISTFDKHSGVQFLVQERDVTTAHVPVFVDCSGGIIGVVSSTQVNGGLKAEYKGTYTPTIDDGASALQNVDLKIERVLDGSPTSVYATDGFSGSDSETDASGNITEQELLIYDVTPAPTDGGHNHYSHEISTSKSGYGSLTDVLVETGFTGSTQTISMTASSPQVTQADANLFAAISGTTPRAVYDKQGDTSVFFDGTIKLDEASVAVDVNVTVQKWNGSTWVAQAIAVGDGVSQSYTFAADTGVTLATIESATRPVVTLSGLSAAIYRLKLSLNNGTPALPEEYIQYEQFEVTNVSTPTISNVQWADDDQAATGSGTLTSTTNKTLTCTFDVVASSAPLSYGVRVTYDDASFKDFKGTLSSNTVTVNIDGFALGEETFAAADLLCYAAKDGDGDTGVGSVILAITHASVGNINNLVDEIDTMLTALTSGGVFDGFTIYQPSELETAEERLSLPYIAIRVQTMPDENFFSDNYGQIAEVEFVMVLSQNETKTVSGATLNGYDLQHWFIEQLEANLQTFTPTSVVTYDEPSRPGSVLFPRQSDRGTSFQSVTNWSFKFFEAAI